MKYKALHFFIIIKVLFMGYIIKKTSKILLGLSALSFVFFIGIKSQINSNSYYLAKNLLHANDTDPLAYELNGDEYIVTGLKDPTSLVTQITIHDTYNEKLVTGIAAKAFANNQNLTEVNISNSIKTIGSNAFNNCVNLEKCNLPSELTYASDLLFGNRTKLTDVTLPEGLKIIPTGCFANCTSLSNVNLPETLTSIDSEAFKNTAISLIKIPSNIYSIGSSAFSWCKQLYNVNFDKDSKLDIVQDNTFEACSELKVINLPKSLKTIGPNAFGYCSKLDSLILPDYLEMIKSNAFIETAISELNLPNSLIKIDNYAFHETNKLSTIQFNWNKLQLTNNLVIGNDLFTCTNPHNLKIVVPKGLLDVYKTTFNDYLGNVNANFVEQPTNWRIITAYVLGSIMGLIVLGFGSYFTYMYFRKEK